MLPAILMLIVGVFLGIFVSCLMFTKGKSDVLDTYIFQADKLVVDNGAIILKDTVTGREAFKRLSEEDKSYIKYTFLSFAYSGEDDSWDGDD